MFPHSVRRGTTTKFLLKQPQRRHGKNAMPPVSSLIRRNEPTQVIREAARRNGMHSLREDAMRKAEAGISTLEEVIRVTMMDED